MSSIEHIKWRPNSFMMGCLLILLTPVFQTLALDSSKTLFQYNCRSWTRQNGLPANGVNAIAQTKDGYIWLGTAMGLVRFDGSEFKLQDSENFSQLPSTIVTSLSASSAGGLWFGFERGSFGFYDGKTVTYSGRDERVGTHLNVNAVLETGGGNLWVGTETLLARLTKNKFYETLLTGPEAKDRFDVMSVCQGSKGRVWLGTMRRGLYFWQDGNIIKFPDAALEELTIRSLVEDKQGQIWIGTERGLICYDANLQRKPLPFPWYETRSLLADREGAIWAGTSGGGVVRYLNDVSTTFRKSDGLADDFVMSLAEDQEGSVWVGTRNGLSQFSDVKIPTFGKSEGLAGDFNISVSASPTGGLWVATSEGITYFDGTAHPYSTNAGLANTYIKRAFEARNGDVYLVNGSMDIEVLSGGQVIARYPNKTWPLALAEDAQGIIVAVGGDLYRVGTNYYAPYSFVNNQKPPLGWVFNLASDPDGSLWVACDNGVCEVKDGAFKLWTKKDGLPDSKVIWVYCDTDKTIWAGTEGGLAILRHGRARTVTRDNGLFDNIIYSILPDDHGSLWAASSRGFFRVSREMLTDFADGKTDRVQCQVYDGLESVKSFERNQQDPSGCKTTDGRIWFPTALGIVMITPTNLAANLVPPKIDIQSVRVNGRELNTTLQSNVPPGKGELEFHYAGLSYIAPLKIQYRYKLDGYDKEWVEAGTRRSAFYTNLKPGPYRFQVCAGNEDGVWSTAATGFNVNLLPHFYQTIWFMVLAGALVIVALFALYGWRVKLLKQKQRQLQEAHDLLEAKVEERTGELAQSNSSLKGQIEERKRMQLEVERIHRELMDASRQAGQAEVATSVLHNVGNVLNSVNVSTALITDRLRNPRRGNLTKAVSLIRQHEGDLTRFFTTDERGSKLLSYLEHLARYLETEQADLLTEITGLTENVDHIKQIVAMQQTYAKAAGVTEQIAVSDLVDSVLKMHSAAYQRHSVNVVREFENLPPVTVDKHKVLQILVNVLHNAKYACDEGGKPEKQVVVRIRRSSEDRLHIEVTDNGVGIARENLTRIFSHGFTTRKDGHGFGLHSAVLAAKEVGGALMASSDGLGTGATFILELPFQPAGQPEPGTDPHAVFPEPSIIVARGPGAS